MRDKRISKIVREALREDIGKGDLTTFFCVSPQKNVEAFIYARERGVLCGVDVAQEVFLSVDPLIKFKRFKKDGDKIKRGEAISCIRGKATSILKAERVALNFLSFLSGIATYTHKFVEKVGKTKVKIMDTRKTTPTLRFLEKYAVRVGGGYNHRKGLWDGILIKDNHLRASQIIAGRGRVNQKRLGEAITIMRKNLNYKIEVEVENFFQFKKIIPLLPDIVLLDNFSLSKIRKAVEYRNKFFPQIKLEVSGGVTLDNVGRIAKTGVDFISVGSITHSPESIDFSLEISK